MELMTSRWTDDRIDDLKNQVDDLGRRMDARFDKVDERFLTVGEEIRETQRMVIGLHATITRLSLALLAVAGALLVTHLG
ncbi:MAG: hypothetical protein ACM3N0_03660 [Chloroflexota bacterium]